MVPAYRSGAVGVGKGFPQFDLYNIAMMNGVFKPVMRRKGARIESLE
jgi:hypothetical protein